MSECNCGQTFRTAEDYRDHLPCVSDTIETWRARAELAERDNESLRNLCKRMHEACVGDAKGPRAGVVEDVANLRTYAIRTRVALDECVELTDKLEKLIDARKRAQLDLGAIALKYIDPKDQITRKRVELLLKAGDEEETAQSAQVSLS